MDTMEQREVEIDLIDFLFDVLSHWRGLIACILIGAVLGGGLSYVKNATAGPEEEAIGPEFYEDKLTLQEQTDVKTVLKYDAMMKSYANNPVLGLDADHVAEGSLILNVSSPDSQDTKSIIQTITRFLNSTEYYLYVADKENYTDDIRLLYLDAFNSVAESEMVAAAYTLANNTSDSSHFGTIELKLFGESEEFCQNVLKDSEEFLTAKHEKLSELYGDYDVQVLSETVSTVAETRVTTVQADLMSKYASYKTAKNNIVNVMSEEQKAYYDLLSSGETEDVKSNETVAARPQVSKKMLVLGAFGLFVLYGMYLFVAYAFNGRWQNHSSYKETYGITDLGTIRKSGTNQKRGLDAIIARARLRGLKELSVEEAVDTLSSGIALQTEKEAIRTLAFVGANHGADTEAQMKALSEALSKKNGDITVKTLYDVSYNATAIDQLADVDAVVLVETANQSRLGEMTKEILLLTNQKIRILGGVTI